MGYYEYVATCLFGLEKFLADEIEALGYKKLETVDGRVTFGGDEDAVARFNIFSRYAQRLYIKLGSFYASTFTELFDGTKELPFECFIGKDDCFPVTGSSIKSKLTSIPDCQSIIKKAIVEQLTESYRVDWFKESGTLYRIEFFISRDIVTIMIDTSGAPLHKRGYRPDSNAAPLRETLAAAMVKIARPRTDVLLWDPFCGSGTIAVEAAMLMTNTAPGINRGFAAQQFEFLDNNIWKRAKEEAKDKIIRKCEFEAFASDIDDKCVSLTKANAKRAGVENNIRAFKMDMRDIKTNGRRGTIVCNPPYGERLMDLKSVEKLYNDMGNAFSALDNWQIYIISSFDGFEKAYGKNADKIRKLYNGRLKCNYYQYFKNKKVRI